MVDSLEEKVPEFQTGEPFPEKAQRFLDALYDAQKTNVKTDREKINLLRYLMDDAQIMGFEKEQDERKAYEFGYLVQLGIL
jgi:methyl coenzyme M reductase gamma subunit